MVNKARAAGTYAENGIRDFMNQWYPDSDGEGQPWNRHTSKGSLDEGDVLGPFTSIEAKNYRKPPASALLDNAQGKGLASKRRYWFLCYKAAGFSVSRAGRWHAMTTVESLFANFGVRPEGMEGATLEEILEQIPDLCAGETVIDGSLLEPAPGRHFPEFLWTPRLIFSNAMSGMDARRKRLIADSGADEYNLDERLIPFVITPRRDPGGIRPVGEWYVYSTLMGFARVLETLGVQPQDADEYAEPEPDAA